MLTSAQTVSALAPFRPRRDRPRPRSFGRRLAVLLLLVCLGTARGYGGDIVMLVSGLAGESTTPGYRGWIDVAAMSHSVSRFPPARPSHGALQLSKRLDSATPRLYDLLNRGTIISTVQLEFTRGTPTYQQFYKINLQGVQLESVNTAAAGASGQEPFEDVALVYEQIAWSYTQVDTPSKAISTALWSVTTNGGTYSTGLTDTDGDGMPDAYELANGLNPRANDASADPDGDGLTNYQEFLTGTNPRDFNSVFRVSRVNLANGQVRITWNSIAGKTYTLSAASEASGPYTPVRNVPAAGTGETYTDFPPAAARRFYRVSTP